MQSTKDHKDGHAKICLRGFLGVCMLKLQQRQGAHGHPWRTKTR